ncbi:hydrogenase iron-sulfur subunit [Desulfogranum marinum]|uniref:hydrogenase iron-sulfur subunit n=1 Tax=Desulfogranum marinum TaxID=453220 RepID=UPI001963DC04|nr:hydrogenase iron-sulfur subunit [Desulfogranum marinum]MBM9514288.1 hydrogenase iron-sulfur subunit [Desulfogranum marinum]
MDSDVKIIAFCCNWCSYAAADLAGISRIQYPCSVRIIRVMCSGMVHPDMILHALNQGADGVMLIGCHLGECHYQDGNYKALARMEILEEILADLGYQKEQLQTTWLSANEPNMLVDAVYDMNERLLELKGTVGK